MVDFSIGFVFVLPSVVIFDFAADSCFEFMLIVMTLPLRLLRDGALAKVVENAALVFAVRTGCGGNLGGNTVALPLVPPRGIGGFPALGLVDAVLFGLPDMICCLKAFVTEGNLYMNNVRYGTANPGALPRQKNGCKESLAPLFSLNVVLLVAGVY